MQLTDDSTILSGARLSAVVVHFGEPGRTRILLQRLQSCNAVSQIVVVLHDTYPDRSSGVDWIESENRGYAAGLNSALRFLSDRDVDPHSVLAVTPDVNVDCSSLESLVREHLASGADCTFPVLREANRFVYGYRFSALGSLQLTRNPQWFSGACFIFNANAWKKVEGFDESYFHYFEDRDFCLRLKQARLRIHQARAVLLEHDAKSGADYPGSELPRYAVRSHLLALKKSDLLGPLSFLNVTSRHFFYLFRWRKGWRGIPKWRRGIEEFFRRRL